MGRRTRRVTILLPGERRGRRSFLKGLGAVVALAAGGGGAWLGTRRTRPAPDVGGPFAVFTPEEATVLLAIADRLVPEREGFPRPRQLRLAERIDRIAAMAHPATQGELRRLVRLFENALSGLALEVQPRLFTESPPAAQDQRLAAWAQSRLGLRRTGYRALKRLVLAAYYASPETYAAVGYPGPPLRPARAKPQPRSPGGDAGGPRPTQASRPAPQPSAPPSPPPDASATAETSPPAPPPEAPGAEASAPDTPAPSPAPRRRGIAKSFDAQPLDQPLPLPVTPDGQ